MALWFYLKVNDERIGTFYAQRRESSIPADWVCTYDVTVVDQYGEHRAVVRHSYRDGAFALVQAALAATLPKPEVHAYISTACQHGEHERCRRTCKFCPAECRCDCGHQSETP